MVNNYYIWQKTIEISQLNYNGKRLSKIVKYRKLENNDQQNILPIIKQYISQNVIYRISLNEKYLKT